MVNVAADRDNVPYCATLDEYRIVLGSHGGYQ